MIIPIDSSGQDITISEVLGGSQRDLDDMLTIHSELSPEYAHYQPYMRTRAQHPPDANPLFIEHWWLLRFDGEAAAINITKYVPGRNCGIGLETAIRPAYRKRTFGDYSRLAEALFRTNVRQFQADAEALGRPNPVGLIGEAEDYLLDRYDSYGFIRLPIDYLEPSNSQEALAAGEREGTSELVFHPLTLCLLKNEKSQLAPSDPAVLRDIACAFLVDHYGLPEDHANVRRALASISRLSG